MDARKSERANLKEDRTLSLNMDTADNVVHAGAKAAEVATPKAEITSDALLDTILTTLDDNKGEDIVQIDLRGKSSIGDYMVVVSGRSSRQVAALAEKLVSELKSIYGLVAKIEGKDAGDWVLIDTGDVIVHIFRPEVREFYQLEKMWLPGEAPAPQA